jgi:hypothetical protein
LTNNMNIFKIVLIKLIFTCMKKKIFYYEINNMEEVNWLDQILPLFKTAIILYFVPGNKAYFTAFYQPF